MSALRLAVGAAVLALAFVAPARAADCPAATALGDGIHVLFGSGGAASAGNDGRAANTVILVGTSGVTVVDPGPHRRAGEALRCAVARITDLPVVALVATHPHPENVLAADAFPAATTTFHAGAVTARTMRERCTRCIERLSGQVGEAAMTGTVARIPERTVTAPTEIAPGGRRLRLIPLGAGHSPEDLAVLDLVSATLIGGDVANVGELPDLRDGTLKGSRAALSTLQGLGARQVVPGRGPAFVTAELARPAAYLAALDAAAREAATAGEFLQRMPGEAALAGEFRRFAEFHPLNLQHAYREAEAEWWESSRR